MKSAAYASFKSAGAIPQEQDDDCHCPTPDPWDCLENARIHRSADDAPIRGEKCGCRCHKRFIETLDSYALSAATGVVGMMFGGKELVDAIQDTVRQSIRGALKDRRLTE